VGGLACTRECWVSQRRGSPPRNAPSPDEKALGGPGNRGPLSPGCSGGMEGSTEYWAEAGGSQHSALTAVPWQSAPQLEDPASGKSVTQRLCWPLKLR